jgi:putative chitinase
LAIAAVPLPAGLLQQALGIPPARAAAWAGPIGAAVAYAQLHSVARLSRWLGQVGHETMRLRYTAELWGPTPQQLRYEPVTTLSQRLGNTQPGDGRRYAGHGLIQVTGRHNHARVRDRLRARLGPAVPDFEAHPRLLCQPDWAALSAADYWVDRALNRWADAGDDLTLTRRINGGTNGLADRLALTAQARAACNLWGYPAS